MDGGEGRGGLYELFENFVLNPKILQKKDIEYYSLPKELKDILGIISRIS